MEQFNREGEAPWEGTDLHMPNQDGLSFVGMLRKVLPDLPIIVSSGRLEEEAERQFRALGLTSFLDKPCNEHQLAETLSRLFPTPSPAATSGALQPSVQPILGV